MDIMVSERRIACWMPEKKLQKIDWTEFENSAKAYGFTVFKLDLSSSLEIQEPFCVLLHKLTDIIAAEKEGDVTSTNLIHKIETYLTRNPSVVVLDPIPSVRRLLDRHVSYGIIKSTKLEHHDVFTPDYCTLTADRTDLSAQLREGNIKYPFICKPFIGHGAKAHKMSIIFNENGLKDCKIPGVAQNFINHGAVLYKLFIVGLKHFYVERPSLKNFYESSAETICFNSSDVSKAGSQSSLTVLDPQDVNVNRIKPSAEKMKLIADTLREAFCMDLLGIDVVIETSTGRYGLIDVNAYPGYDGFPNFFTSLFECISDKLDNLDVYKDHTRISNNHTYIPQIQSRLMC